MSDDSLFISKSPWIMHGLIKESKLTTNQGASILGNIGHECAGFTQMQERNPVGGGRGGYGWCQWTGARRNQFEAYARRNNLSVDDDKANYGFLIWELRNTERSAIAALKQTQTLADGVRAFEAKFERADPRYKHYDSRARYAKLALDAYNSHDFVIAEAIMSSASLTSHSPTLHDDAPVAAQAPVAEAIMAAGAPGIFASKLVQVANAELIQYQDLTEGESPLKERIGQYWTFVGRPDLDGSDHEVPWSAAFISYMVNLAGAGSAFKYSAQHSTYFYRTINDKLIKKKTSFWGFKPEDVQIQPGDILGMNRAKSDEIDYDWAAHHADYKSHADIVVAVDQAGIHTVGGNVGHAPGQIGRKLFVPHGNTWKNAAADQTAFVVIRSFLP